MDTRRFPRAKIDLEAILRIVPNKEAGFSIIACDNFDVRISEISEGGLLLSTPYFLPKGILIELEVVKGFFLPDKNAFLKGRIMHSKSQKPSGYRCGIEFVDLQEDFRIKIAEYIKSNAG